MINHVITSNLNSKEELDMICATTLYFALIENYGNLIDHLVPYIV